jgi:hypothetical protein
MKRQRSASYPSLWTYVPTIARLPARSAGGRVLLLAGPWR